MVRSIVGFEEAVIVRPGYAVEYDFVFLTNCHTTLETKQIPGPFFGRTN